MITAIQTIAAIAFLLLLGVVAHNIITVYNSLMRLKNNIRKSWSNIDVLLRQRGDEIPNLVNVAQWYMRYERDVLVKITEARSAYMKARTVEGKVKATNIAEKALTNFYAVAENYPKLKADKHFIRLMERITELENQIADRRELYNDSVTIYNTRIESIPDLFIARLLGLNKRSLFRFKKFTK